MQRYDDLSCRMNTFDECSSTDDITGYHPLGANGLGVRRVPPQFFLVFATGTKCTYGPHTSSYVQVKMLWKNFDFLPPQKFLA